MESLQRIDEVIIRSCELLRLLPRPPEPTLHLPLPVCRRPTDKISEGIDYQRGNEPMLPSVRVGVSLRQWLSRSPLQLS